MTTESVNCSVMSNSLRLDFSPPDFSVHGILQARILEGVAIPSPGYLPNAGVEPRVLALHVDSLPSEPQGSPVKYLIFRHHTDSYHWSL